MTSTLLGVALVFRHGDRLGYYQDPTSYSASGTNITPLGEVQEFQSGGALQQRYLNATSAHYIPGMAFPVPNVNQLDVRADASEGQVIVRSAYAVTQGLYPASTQATTTLANGTTVVSPLQGYSYIPVQTVEPAQDISLEGFTSCPAFVTRNTEVYNSAAFKAKAAEAAPFLQSLIPLVGGRNVTLQNMWNIFDYMNVNYIHSESFLSNVSLNTMEQARALANYHEYALFSDTTPGGIGNIAGQTILPLILNALNGFALGNSTTKMLALGTAYKPFLSLFNMTGVENQSIVDYASVAAFELRNSSGVLTVSLNFRNGSTNIAPDGSDLLPLTMFNGTTDVPLATFNANLAPYQVADLGEWCNKCGNTNSRGCDVIAAVNATNDYTSDRSTYGRHHVSPVVAGVIGAMVTLVVALAAMAALEMFRRRKGARNAHSAQEMDDVSDAKR